MIQTPRLVAAPGRLLLLLVALVVLGAVAIQLTAPGIASRHTTWLATPPAVVLAPSSQSAPAPAEAAQSPINQAAAAPAVPATTRNVPASGPASLTPAAASATNEPVAAPANPGQPNCTDGGPPAARDVASRCLGA